MKNVTSTSLGECNLAYLGCVCVCVADSLTAKVTILNITSRDQLTHQANFPDMH